MNESGGGNPKTGKKRGLGTTWKRGGIWYVQVWHRGKRHRESTGSTDEKDANRLLKKRLGDLQAGKPTARAIEKTTLADLMLMLENDFRANNQQLSTIKAPVAHLIRYFGKDCRAIDITTDRVTAYVAERLDRAEGAANGTINRSLAALKRAFHLAAIAKKVGERPEITMLAENNARQGFVSRSEFKRLRDALPDELRDPLEFLYRSGWRVGEMRSLEWRDVDLESREIRLRRENSKNGETRSLPLTREIGEIIERARERRILECPNVFHRDGRPIGLFRKSWATACKAAGLGAILVHDLRRSAVRNMVRAGVPDKVAMSISGHKSRSIFDRYNITAKDDQVRALERTSDYLAAQQQAPANVVPLKKKTA
jgi:integrase